jgi:hypothetical protein
VLVDVPSRRFFVLMLSCCQHPWLCITSYIYTTRVDVHLIASCPDSHYARIQSPSLASPWTRMSL